MGTIFEGEGGLSGGQVVRPHIRNPQEILHLFHVSYVKKIQIFLHRFWGGGAVLAFPNNSQLFQVTNTKPSKSSKISEAGACIISRDGTMYHLGRLSYGTPRIIITPENHPIL